MSYSADARREKVGNVSVAHHVGLALGAHLSCGFDRGLRLVLLHVRDGIYLGADESLLQIPMNLTGGLWRGGADRDRSSLDLHRTGGEEAVKAE